MNYAGCKRKFKIPDYVAHVERCIAREKAGILKPRGRAVVARQADAGRGGGGGSEEGGAGEDGAGEGGADRGKWALEVAGRDGVWRVALRGLGAAGWAEWRVPATQVSGSG